MSSPPSDAPSEGDDAPAEGRFPAEAPAASDNPSDTEEATDASPDAEGRAQCPNCGRTVRGTYCPDCGQEARPTVTVGEVAGDFFQGIVDIEGGFAATLAGLTVRPVEVLRRYLRGARAGVMSPGRYLLASVVVTFVAVRGLIWIGALQDPENYEGPAASADAGNGADLQALDAFFEAATQIPKTQWFAVGITLVSTGLLALILRHLLAQALPSGAKALAFSAFLTGHGGLLSIGGLLPLSLATLAATGRPAGYLVQAGIGLVVATLYVGAVAYGFGTGWSGAVKAGMAVLWTQLEATGVGCLLIEGYVLWRAAPLSALSTEETAAFAVMGALYVLPLVAHGLAELLIWGRSR